MNRTEKQQEVEALRETLRGARNAYFLDYRGLTVAQVSDLRRKVRATKSGYRVVKNRLAIIAVGLAVAALLYFAVARTRVGMLVRAGASNREMAIAMGVNIKRLFTIVFGCGAALCAW